MLFKKPEHKKFDYTPVYYKPEKDPEAKRKERIVFRRFSARNNFFSGKIIVFIILLFLILYFLKKLAIFP